MRNVATSNEDKPRKTADYEAAVTAIGAGEDTCTLGALCISPSPALLLLPALFPSCAFSLFSLPLLLSADGAAVESSAPGSGCFLGGAVQRGISHCTPVNVLSLKLPRAHLRHGLPDLSSARRPALIAPWFALGPSLWAPAALAADEWSMVPSSLQVGCQYAVGGS